MMILNTHKYFLAHILILSLSSGAMGSCWAKASDFPEGESSNTIRTSVAESNNPADASSLSIQGKPIKEFLEHHTIWSIYFGGDLNLQGTAKGETKLTAEETEAVIGKLTTLKIDRDGLYLGHFPRTEKAAQDLEAALENNNQVNLLNIKADQANDNEAAYMATILKNNKTLKSFFLKTPAMNEKSIEAIAKALGQTHTLEFVSLDVGPISDKAMEIIAEGLKTNQSLKTLYLGGSPISEKGQKALSAMLKTNTTLCKIDFLKDNDAETTPLQKEIIAALERNIELKKLEREAIEKASK